MLNVVDEGAGLPVVLLHAYPCDHTMWDAQAVALVGAGYRVIRPDLPGFGTSPLRAEETESLQVMADAVFEALDSLGVDSFVLGGLSLGGYVAMQMVRQQPQRLVALALVDTKATPDGIEAQATRRETAKKALAAGSLQPMVQGMLTGLLGPSTLAESPDIVERTIRYIEAASAQSAAWAMRSMALRPDSLPTLAAFDSPAVVIAGDEDALSSLAEHELMVKVLPQGQLVVINECGHLSAIEKPDAVSQALLAFLGSLD